MSLAGRSLVEYLVLPEDRDAGDLGSHYSDPEIPTDAISRGFKMNDEAQRIIRIIG